MERLLHLKHHYHYHHLACHFLSSHHSGTGCCTARRISAHVKLIGLHEHCCEHQSALQWHLAISIMALVLGGHHLWMD